MAISDLKIKDTDFTAKEISGLPDRPSEAGMSASDLKSMFDAGSKKVIAPKFNALIEAMSGSSGAANVGAAQIDGVSGYTVQDILYALKLLIDTKKSGEIADIEIGKKFDKTEAKSLVKEIQFDESNGVFTIIKYDGSSKTIDTAIEKIALNVRLDGQQFVLTLVDGTEQRVDLSAFITQTEIKDSDTIHLSEEDSKIIARIIEKSIKKEHLDDTVTEYLENKVKIAEQSAANAEVYQTNSKLSADNAKQSETLAKEYEIQSENAKDIVLSKASHVENTAKTVEENSTAVNNARLETALLAQNAKNSADASRESENKTKESETRVENMKNELEPYGAIAVKPDEPKEEKVVLWIQPESGKEIEIPEKNDIEILYNHIKNGAIENAEYHLGFYLDENGDLCQT